MRVGGGAVLGSPTASTVLRRWKRFRCFSSSVPDHMSFIRDVAAISPPQYLSNLLQMLQTRGETIISPRHKQGLIPLAIPLSRNSSGVTTALLRWPTAPTGMDMPVVEVHKHGVRPLAKNINQYIHRILVEEDILNPMDSSRELHNASGDVGKILYRKGYFAESKIPNLDAYLLRKVGLFPDILERKVLQYLRRGDHVSALVTAEFYTKKEHFPGFGRPFAFNAEVLLKVGRTLEAKDAARGSLRSPWWTLGCRYQEIAVIAQWDDEQIEYIEEKVTEEGKQADLSKGKEPAQIALDEAAFLLDLASVEGTWDDCVGRVAECYKEAGLDDVARFILHRD
ncbi:hypothetical protein Ancab_003806 [Ancistrocladus abbreviatus]